MDRGRKCSDIIEGNYDKYSGLKITEEIRDRFRYENIDFAQEDI